MEVDLNTKRLIETLDWAMDQGVQPFMPIYNPDPNSFETKMWANNIVQTGERTRDEVVKVLASQTELQVFDGGVIRMKQGSGSRSELRGLCDWLLAQTLLHGSESAVRRLEEFIEGEHRSVLEILALTGVIVKEEIELPRGVKLVPVSSLPRSAITDLLTPNPIHSFGNPMLRRFVPSPSAALVIKNEDGVELLEEFPDPADDPTRVSNQMLLHRIVQCLTLLGPSCPTEVMQWSQLGSPERVPILGTGHGFESSLQEAYPLRTTTLENHEEAQELVERYLNLDDELGTKLGIPIQRLNMAMRRRDVVDKAIELGIALEALLKDEQDGTEAISLLLRVRGAWLAGGTLEERRHNLALLKDVYDLRSQVVHSGALKTKKKLPVDKARQRADEILRKGSVLCANLIRTVIERERVPDWEDIILTADSDLLPGNDTPPP